MGSILHILGLVEMRDDMIAKHEWWHLNPIAKTKREVHLETLLTMALPYVQRDELSTNTNPYTRHLIAEINEQIKGD